MNFRLALLPLLVASLVTASSTLHSAEAPPAPPALTLAQCIDRALARNFDLEIQRETPLFAAEAVTIARAGFKPVVTVTASAGQTHAAATNSSPANTLSHRSTRIGVTQQLTTGTTVGVSSQLDRSRSDPALSPLNPAYDAELSFSVRQQLLKGFGTAVNTAAIKRAQLGLSRAQLDYRSRVLDVVQATERAYYDVVFAREQLGVRQFALTLARQLHQDSQIRKETGVATELDVLSAEVGVANARRGTLLAEQTVKDTEERLLALIGQFEFDAPLGAMAFAAIETAAPTLAESFRLVKQNVPDLLSAQQAIEQARLDLVVARDGTKPELSVGGAVGLNGLNSSGGSALSDALERQRHSWQVDLSFTYPWGQTGSKARRRQSESTLRQQESRLHQLEQAIEADVRSAVRSVETNLASVTISTQARTLSDRQYELEKARFDAGLSTSYRVLQAQNDLENARIAELQAKVNLHVSYSSLHRLEGSTLRLYGINLP